jgi:hypothetical protein
MIRFIKNTSFIRNASAMWKMHMVQNYDNDILEGLIGPPPPPPPPPPK